MPSFTSPCDPNGTLITPVLLANPELNRSIIVNAEVDTGASHTTMNIGIAETLGINPVDQCLIHAVNSESYCYIYPVHFYFARTENKHYYIGAFLVIAANSATPNVSCLIGRDVLRKGLLIYNGYMNHFSFSF